MRYCLYSSGRPASQAKVMGFGRLAPVTWRQCRWLNPCVGGPQFGCELNGQADESKSWPVETQMIPCELASVADEFLAGADVGAGYGEYGLALHIQTVNRHLVALMIRRIFRRRKKCAAIV